MAENKFIIKNGVVVESSENNSLVFDIQGINRRILSINDNTSGEILNLSNIAGGTAISVDSNGKVSFPSNMLVTGATFMGSIGIGTVGTSNILTLRGATSGAGITVLDPTDGSTHFNIHPGASSTVRQMNINFPGVTNSTDNLFVLRFNGDNNKWFFGDNGTTAAINTIHDMTFSAAGLGGPVGMTLLTNGNFGLGAITPDAKMQIHLNSGATAEGQNSKSLSITSITSDNSFANYTHYGAYIAPEFNGNYNCSTGYGLYLNPTISGHDGFGTMYSFYNASVYNSYFNGSIGIGVVPAQQLDIYKSSGGTYWNEGIRVRRGGASTQYGIVNYYGGALRITAIVEGGTSSGEIYFERHNAGSGTPSTSMMINTVGNLGVGTINQVYRTEIKPATDTYSLALIQSDSTQAGWGFQADTSGNLQIARYNTSMSNKITISSTGAANFVSSVAATAFTENGTTLSDKYLGITATAANSSKLGGELPSYYALASALSAYLPLSGGELSSRLSLKNQGWLNLYNTANDNYISINYVDGLNVIDFYDRTSSVYASIRTGGFIKSGSSSSYLLTGDGGHVATSTFALASSLSNYSLTSHSHSGVYEPAFAKNTAFNKSFGASAGTVAEGNDSRIVNGQTAFGWGNHASAGYALASSLSNYSLTSHTHSYITSTRYDSGDPKPNQLTVGLSFQFSLPDGGWYNALNMRSYGDPNYLATQIVSSANNPGSDTGYSFSLKYREGRNATWLGWKTILDSSNYSSYALPLSGGILSGNVSFTTLSTPNYNTAVLQGNWNGAGYWGLGSDGIHTIKIDQINGLGSTQAFAGATDIVLKLGTKTVIDSGNIGSQSVASAGYSNRLNANLGLLTHPGNLMIGGASAVTHPQSGLFPAVDNSNYILTINRHPGEYNSQLGFSSNGNLYYRSFSATEINTTQPWKTIIDSGNIGSQSVNYAKFIDTSGYLSDENLAVPTSSSFGIYKVTASTATGNDGIINTWTWGTGVYTTQLFVEIDPLYSMSIRHRDGAGNWVAWKRIWTEANLTNTLSSGYLPYWNGTNGRLENTSIAYISGEVLVNSVIKFGFTNTTGIYLGDTLRHLWPRADGALALGTNGTDRIFISAAGNVGIGYSAGTEITNNKLAVNGTFFAGDSIVRGQLAVGNNTNGTAIIDAHSGYAYYGVNNYSTGLKIANAGDAYFSHSATATAFYHSSDMTLKDVINPLDDVLGRVRTLDSFYYKLKSDESGKIYLGMSAQQFNDSFTYLTSRDSNDKLLLDYPRISVIAIKAIQELDTTQQQHEKEVADLKTNIEKLELRLRKLEEKLFGPGI